MDAPGAFPDFHSAAQAVMIYLHLRVGFDLWMVTRVHGEEWIILEVEDHGYGIKEGSVFRWADTFCSHMVDGNAPNVAPRCEQVQVYANAPINKQIKIGAYVGFPLRREDGTLFGTLCAVHPAPQPNQILDEQPLIELFSQLLSTILNAELKTLDGSRQEERLAAQKFIDRDTDIYNRRGFEELLAAEEVRCTRFGHPACVIIVDVKNIAAQPEDSRMAVMHSAARAISAVTRVNDVVARLSTYQIGILGVDCDLAGTQALLRRVNEALATERISARVAHAARIPPLSLMQAWDDAEADLKSADPTPDRTP